MSVYKRKREKGARWYVYLVLPDGSKFRKSVGTKKEAEKVEQKLKSEIAAGKWGIQDTEDIPFSVLAKEYFIYAEDNKAKSTSTINKYRIEAHLIPYFGNTLLSRITPQMVDDYKSLRIKAGASPNTINRELANLSHMLKMAVQWRYIDRNVVSTVSKMKVPERPCRFLSQEEIRCLLESARGNYIYPIIVTALHTGMRRAELLNLRWSDIDFGRRTVTVQAKEDWHTKNYRSRTSELTPVLYDVLEQHKEMQVLCDVQCDYVFTYKGGRIKNGIDTSLRRAVKEAGLENVTLHTFRHTFASQLVMAGVPLRDVQELMGHRSFETTLKYAHLSAEHVKKQVLRLPFASA
ncbi:tyrosine-type recombinase/integrase [Candidatus Poribacteria bacterium]